MGEQVHYRNFTLTSTGKISVDPPAHDLNRYLRGIFHLLRYSRSDIFDVVETSLRDPERHCFHHLPLRGVLAPRVTTMADFSRENERIPAHLGEVGC